MQFSWKRILPLMIALVALLIFWQAGNQSGSNVSVDSLSQGIGERWGGGLPDGYEAQVADDLEIGGHLFAKLRYEAAVDELLKAWKPASETVLSDFWKLVEAQRNLPDLPSEHQSLLETLDPAPNSSWLAYTAQEDSGEIVLLYDPGSLTMYVAEAQT